LEIIKTIRLIYKLGRLTKGVRLNVSIPDELLDEVTEDIEQGKAFQSVHDRLQEEHDFELSFRDYKTIEEHVLGEDRVDREPSEVVYPEGGDGSKDTGYGGHGPGVWVAPKASLNLLAAGAVEIIQEESKKLQEHGFNEDEVRELVRGYAKDFREKTDKYLDAEVELDSFLDFVKKKIDERLAEREETK